MTTPSTGVSQQPITGINIPSQEPFFPMQEGTPSSTTTSQTNSDSSSPKTPPPTPIGKTISHKPKNPKNEYSTTPPQADLHDKLKREKRKSGRSESKDDLICTHKGSKSPRSHPRGTSLISSDDIAEVQRRRNNNNNNKDKDKDTGPILSFRGSEPLERRNKFIVTNDELDFPNFKDFQMHQGKEIESLDNQFEKYFHEHEKDIISAECTTDTIMATIYDRIIQKEYELIEEQTKKNKFLPALQLVLTVSQRARELFCIIQNMLIPTSPIFIRLCVQGQVFIKFFKQTKQLDKKSPFTDLYHAALLELRSLKPVPDAHKELLSEGINLSNFLSCIDKIKNHQFSGVNEGGSPKLLIDLNKKIYPLICLAFGDSKKNQNSHSHRMGIRISLKIFHFLPKKFSA